MLSLKQPVALEDLAIFGGSPRFGEAALHVGRPNLGSRERLLDRIGAIYDRRWLTNDGPFVTEFEERVAHLSGTKHCVAISSGTLGLQLVARALDISGEVIVPAFTFVATAHALAWLGLTPVFCDVDRRTHTIDPDSVADLVTSRTSAVVGVHVWGRPCEVDRLAEVARACDLRLIFDAAHALGCSHHGEPIGGFGDAEVFSFHATKVASAAEGGAVTTNDGELAGRLRLMRNFGFAGYDTVVELGTNGKMSELAAAVGLTSLDELEFFIAHNRRNHLLYERELRDIPGLELMPYDDAERHNHHYVVVEVSEDAPRDLRRDDLIAVLRAENVLARRYFYPGCHRMDPYLGVDGAPVANLPATDDLTARVMVLPTGTAIDEAEIEAVCSILRACVRHAGDVRGRLAGTTLPI
jgi:dTDP-4-amino-4,6-dideoxygalactose transaminase